MNNKINFWEESPGNQSANRLIFILGSAWLMGISTYSLIEKVGTLNEIGIFLLLFLHC